jgi:hypothetical protein
MADSLEAQFHEQMVNIYRNALKEAHYNAKKFLEMVTMQGGLAAAKTLLHTPYLPDGFAELWQRGRLDLTMEYMLIQAPWKTLFTEEELKVAADRLAGHSQPPAGKSLR